MRIASPGIRQVRQVGTTLLATGLALFAGLPTAAASDALQPGTWALPDGSTCCSVTPSRLLADSPLNAEANVLALSFDDDPRDRAGLRRDTAYFMGYQFAAVAILYAMPESVTNWSAEDKSDYSMSKWWNNVQDPQMDSDDFYLNWIIHPYWGAAYFVRARERGYSNGESFWYSALLSTMFEFGAEALAEEPSYQDLVVTPVLGSFVGVWFMQLREGVRERTDERGRRSTGDTWIWVLTDPLGSLNRQVDRLFGRDTDIMFRPFVADELPFDDPYQRPYVTEEDPVFGLNVTVNW